MCGICGFYQSERVAGETVLHRMNSQITHRGPDDEGYYFSPPVALAARRLSIIDLVTGHQPLASDTGNSWITYNGEVYNFPELRQDLIQRGRRFKTNTDTEVIVNLYEEFGLGFVGMLRGMFALAIYDRAADRLLLARDHAGIKPLYYFIDRTRDGIVFASEIKAILQFPGIARKLDHEALDHFLTLEYIPAPFTIFNGIRKLPAGHMLLFEKSKATLHQYWDVRPYRMRGSLSDLKEEFLALLEDAVRMRLISDVPLGAFLSGGIDSSAIVAMMTRATTARIKTFSIGFDDRSYSELPYSYEVARTFNTDHFTEILSPDIADLAVRLAGFLDEPLGDFSNFPTYLVSKIARGKVTVVLSGDGGDEIFGGYEHYIAQKISKFLDVSLLRTFHPLLAKTTRLFPPSGLKKGLVNRIKRYSEGLDNSYSDRHFRWMLFLSSMQKRVLYSTDYYQDIFTRPLSDRSPFREHFGASLERYKGINRDLYLDFKTYLADDILVKVDRMSMAVSLEARVPLLDKKIIEFAFSLPAHLKLHGITGKYFFKDVMRGILPAQIIDRRKEGFSIPIKNWLKTELRDLMAEYLSEKRVRESGLFNYRAVQTLISDHLANRENHAHRLWSLMSFFMWKERFLD